MDDKSREMLSEILAKPISAMSDGEKAIVRARRSYLTEAQTRDLESVLETEVKVEKVDYSKMKKAELLAIAEQKGIVVAEDANKADIIGLIEETEE